MSRIHSLYTSFNNGELTPRALGRARLSKYTSSLNTCSNFLPTVYGGLYNRPGTAYIATLEDPTSKSILIPFEASSTEAYILETNSGYFRLYRNNTFVTKTSPITNSTFDSDISGWSDESEGSSTVLHNTNNMQLTQVGSDKAKAIAPMLLKAGNQEYTLTLDISTNNLQIKVGTSTSDFSVLNTILTPGIGKSVNFTPSAPLNSPDLYIYIETVGEGTVEVDNISLNTPIYKIPHPYTDTQLDDLRWAQSNDVLYFVHPDVSPRQLIRYNEDQWQMTEIDFTDGPYLDTQQTTENYIVQDRLTTTLTPSDTSGTATFTASTDLFKATDVGRLIRYRGTTDDTGEISYTGTGNQTYFDIPFFPKDEDNIEVYLVSSSGKRVLKIGGGADYTIEDEQVKMQTAPSSSDLLIIRRQDSGSGEWGYGKIVTFSSATEVDVQIIRPLDSTNTSTDWRLGSWGDTTGYPKLITFHEQRLIFGNTYTQPLAIWGSQAFDFINFSPDNILNLGDVDEDTSYTFVVASNILDEIKWVSSQRTLLLGTLNNVYNVSGGTNNASITPTSINIKKEVSVGSRTALITQTDTRTLFIGKLGRGIRSLGYRFEIDGYVAEDVNLFAEHIGKESNFKKIVYAEVPNKTFWILRENGTIVSMTYLPDQDVTGWARHTFGGTDVIVKDLAVIPTEKEDRVYFLIERTINGQTVQYIEYLTEDFGNTLKEDAKYSDSLVTYSGSSISTITGLDHLEGEEVVILANGNIHPNRTITSGQLALEYPVTKAQIGLPYTCTMETIPIEAGIPFGTTQMTIQRIIEAGINFLDSLNCQFGYSPIQLDTLTFRSASDRMDTSPPLFTGYKILKFPHGHELDSKIVVYQNQPLPVHIRAIVIKIEVTDK